VCRAGVVALVCKSWHKVERESPHQPTHILVGGEQRFNRAELLWLLRDTSKLLKVSLYGKFNRGDFRDFWEDIGQNEAILCTQSLLTHLAGKAPALTSLLIQPPRAAFEGRSLNFLPLLGGLTRLKRLTIIRWKYSDEDVSNFRLLGNLHNLEVSSCDSPAPSAGTQTPTAVHKL